MRETRGEDVGAEGVPEDERGIGKGVGNMVLREGGGGCGAQQVMRGMRRERREAGRVQGRDR